MTFRVDCHIEHSAPLGAAFEALADPDIDDLAGMKAMAVVRSHPFKVNVYAREIVPPEKIAYGEETLAGIHSMCQQLAIQRGMNCVASLMEAYGITKFADLPANRYSEFAAEIRSAFGGADTYQVEG